MLKLNTGVSKKIGLPDYGSLGASCNLEIELDHTVFSDPNAFKDRVRKAFSACRQAVEEELARHQSSPGQATTSADSGAGQSNGHNGHLASEKQFNFLHQLAGQIQGLDSRQLENLSQKMFGKPIAGLTSLDASGLIDTLKSLKAGEIDLNAALNGASS